jgi:quinol monooxygenase YgiN
MLLIRPIISAAARFVVRLSAGLLVLALALSAISADEKPHPIIAQVKATVKDPDKPFTLVVSLQTKDGAQEKFEAAVARATKLTRREKGCLAYELNRDPKTPGEYVLYERWENLTTLEAHLKSRHITKLLAELGDLLLAGPPKVRILVPAGD